MIADTNGPLTAATVWIEIGATLSVLGFGFMLGVIRQIRKIKMKNSEVIKSVDWATHSQIHELLTELRISAAAARTQLVQFHNGGTFVDGVSMMKMSLTHESVSKGVSTDGGRLQGILLSLFVPMIIKITEDTPSFFDVKNEKDSFFKNFFVSDSVHSYVALPVRHNGNITGYLMVQWCSPSKAKIAERRIEEITTEIATIRSQIQIHLDEQIRAKLL